MVRNPFKKKKDEPTRDITELTQPKDPFGTFTGTPPDKPKPVPATTRQTVVDPKTGAQTITQSGKTFQLSKEEGQKLAERQRLFRSPGTESDIYARIQALGAESRRRMPIEQREKEFAALIQELLSTQPVPERDEFGLTEEIGAGVASGAIKKGIQFAAVGGGVGLAGGPAAPVTVPAGAAIGFAAGVTTGAIEAVTVGLKADRQEAIRQSTQTAEKNNRFIQDTITAYQSGQIAIQKEKNEMFAKAPENEAVVLVVPARFVAVGPVEHGGIGGSMDLAIGAKKVIVAMTHTTKDGKPKIVKECRLPLTARECVNLLVTDLAVIEVTSCGLLLKELALGWTVPEVQALTEPELIVSPGIKEIEL